MILRNGITGFGSVEKITEINNILGKIKYPYIYFDIIDPQVNNNYFTITIENKIDNKKFKLLINNTYYIIAGVTIESMWMELEFINLPNDFIEQLRDNKNIILDKNILEKEVSNEEIKILDKDEINQINYWKSKMYGEIIFNGYD
jgi:rRNA processing protein Gar1